MNKYQIYEASEQFNHAGAKATADIAQIAETLGFQRLIIYKKATEESLKGKITRQIDYLHGWNEAEKTIGQGGILLLQHPFHHRQLTREKTLFRMKNQKKCRIISFVHDVEELRGYRYSNYYAKEFDIMLALADQIIVHNDAMKDWFLAKGVKEDKLVSLEIFDYLICDGAQRSRPMPQFEKTLTIAGNLDTNKSGYIRKLCELNSVRVDLYGPHFDPELGTLDNIRYHGEVPRDEIHTKLTKGFGLVWDGMDTDGCQGQAGQYLKYNNPHKLSLYLAAGLPVVIWNGAAEAKFVKEHQVGFGVDRIEDCVDELNRMTAETWLQYVENVSKTGARLREGYYARRALETAVRKITAP